MNAPLRKQPAPDGLTESLKEIRAGLTEMESPLLESRNLAMAVRMMAGSGDLPKDAGTALEVVADLIFEKLIEACGERDRLWKLAGETYRAAS
jgi:hypothetical protein